MTYHTTSTAKEKMKYYIHVCFSEFWMFRLILLATIKAVCFALPYSRLFSQGANFDKFPKWAYNSGNLILNCWCFIRLDWGFEIFGILSMIVRQSCLGYFSKKRFEAHFPDPSSPLSSKMLPSTVAAVNTEVMCVMNGHAIL